MLLNQWWSLFFQSLERGSTVKGVGKDARSISSHLLDVQLYQRKNNNTLKLKNRTNEDISSSELL